MDVPLSSSCCQKNLKITRTTHVHLAAKKTLFRLLVDYSGGDFIFRTVSHSTSATTTAANEVILYHDPHTNFP
jgi:hypothetical protein